MKSKLIHEEGTEKTYVLAYDAGDEVVETLSAFATEQRIGAARIMALGGFREARLGFYQLDLKEYKPIEVNEQVEVVSLLGNIAMDTSATSPTVKVHALVVVSRADGSAQAGHLIRGVVRPTLEMFVVADHARLEKHHDAATGLQLLRL